MKTDKDINRLARNKYALLLQGMQEGGCYHIVLTRGRCIDLGMREEEWRRLRIRLKKQWPLFQAWTVMQWSTSRGVHLHVIIKGTPGIKKEWIDHVVSLMGNGSGVYLVPIEPNEAPILARYVTRQLGDKKQMRAWPRYFRPVTTTRGWCPEWMTNADWTRRTPTRRGVETCHSGASRDGHCHRTTVPGRRD